MNKHIKSLFLLLQIVVTCLLLTGCHKYLDAKPDAKLVIPKNIADLQALLDNYIRVNYFDPSAGEASADNYYLSDADWASLFSLDNKRMYTWEKDYLFSTYPNNWSQTYDVVYVANTVLDHIDKYKETGSLYDWNNVKGQALYHRAKSFSEAAAIWCLAYDPSTAATDLGIPLRLNGNFNEVSARPTLQVTYDQVISDVKASIPLLPVTSLHVMRPSKAAAYGLLARVYLNMRQYTLAGLYADSCLRLYNRLLDYNNYSPAAIYPFTQFNAEVIMENRRPILPSLNRSIAKIDSTLYLSYAGNDLRKTLFFRDNGNGSYGFKGSYEGGLTLFGGIATDEIYLIRAESYARAGNIDLAMKDLNTLLVTRWKTGTFVPFAATDAADALQSILTERRKELLMRGLRWMDIKRLNKEGIGITLTRKLNNQTYTLPPNDPRYALPLPEDIILLSGMVQNYR